MKCLLIGIRELPHYWNGAQIRPMDDKLYTGTGVFFIGIAAGSQTQFSMEACFPPIITNGCPSTASLSVKNEICYL
jgi:hypothetical protein